MAYFANNPLEAFRDISVQLRRVRSSSSLEIRRSMVFARASHGDPVTVLHHSHGPIHRHLRGYMTHHEPVASPRESLIDDQRDFIAETLADSRSSGVEHLPHSWPPWVPRDPALRASIRKMTYFTMSTCPTGLFQQAVKTSTPNSFVLASLQCPPVAWSVEQATAGLPD